MKVFYINRSSLRKFFILFIIAAMVITAYALFAYTGRHNEKYNGPDRINEEIIRAGEGLNTYSMDVFVDTSQMVLECRQELEYTNSGTGVLHELYFHLYPNVFKHPDSAPFFEEDFSMAYPNGFSPGYISINSVKVNNENCRYEITGKNDDLLRLILKEELAPEEKILVEMSYDVNLPNCHGRFGYGEYAINITNWYPILCVLEEEGWKKDPYYRLGDPFYSDISNYSVNIRVSVDYTVASTGWVKGVVKDNGYNVWNIKALTVRDFAFVISDRFNMAEKQVKGTAVKSYFFNRAAGEKVLQYASDALEFFNQYFGEYPYNSYSVVETNFFIGGMEYPNLIMLDMGLYANTSSHILEYITVHETAHQWWYGIVGNNQVDEAWLDESLAEYSTVLYFEHKYGSKAKEDFFEQLIVSRYNMYVDIFEHEKNEVILKPIYEFNGWLDYNAFVYAKGAIMLDALRNKTGHEVFREIMQKYYDRYKFKNARTRDFIGIVELVTGEDWNIFFSEWLLGE